MSIFTPGLAVWYWSNSLRIRSGRWLAPPEKTRSEVWAKALVLTEVASAAAASARVEIKIRRFMVSLLLLSEKGLRKVKR